MSVCEPLSARKIARLRFLEQEEDHLRSYKSNLEFLLVNTKHFLSEILSTKTVTSYRRNESLDTEKIMHVPLKTVEKSLQTSIELFKTYKDLKKRYEIVHGKALISEQLSDESVRKEQELIEESEDRIGELKYFLDKKEIRENNLKIKIEAVESQMFKLKNEKLMVLGLSEENLSYYKQMENIKSTISAVSKSLQITEFHTEELSQYYNTISEQLNQCQILVKNPLVRNKRINLNASPGHDMSFIQNNIDSDSSSSEVIFPDKLSISTTSKPKLPKLDFSKVLKQTRADKKLQEPQNKYKSKEEFFERKCKEKTDFLNQLRESIKNQISKNSRILEEIQGKKYESPFLKKKIYKKKKAMSNTLEYLTFSPEIARVHATEESQEKSEKSESSIVSFKSFSSLEGMELPRVEGQEADSVLIEYIQEINNY